MPHERGYCFWACVPIHSISVLPQLTVRVVFLALSWLVLCLPIDILVYGFIVLVVLVVAVVDVGGLVVEVLVLFWVCRL